MARQAWACVAAWMAVAVAGCLHPPTANAGPEGADDGSDGLPATGRGGAAGDGGGEAGGPGAFVPGAADVAADVSIHERIPLEAGSPLRQWRIEVREGGHGSVRVALEGPDAPTPARAAGTMCFRYEVDLHGGDGPRQVTGALCDEGQVAAGVGSQLTILEETWSGERRGHVAFNFTAQGQAGRLVVDAEVRYGGHQGAGA